MKSVIYCEVYCNECGGLATGNGYYSPKRIKMLKEITKDWIHHDKYGVLCPKCQMKLLGKQN